jgi:uncharacterized membrane protein YhaH (DUF805 family)
MIVHEQLSFQDALSLATKRIFETKGRSRRSEFWWAMLVAYFISNFLPPFWLVTIPISIRRLHDTGRSGWWMFFPVVATIIIVLMCVSDVLSFMTMDDFEDTITPFVVFGKYIFFCGIVSVYQIVMIIFFCQDSVEGENRYGASPKYEEEPPCVPPEERKE